MSEIISSTSPDKALTLGCEITDFYPPNISVTWLKLREGEQDDGEEEVIEGGELWGPIQTHPKLCRATASLKRNATNQQNKERGGGIKCRVEHCSLEEPIERHWRNVGIGMNLHKKSSTIYNLQKDIHLYLYFFIYVCILLVAPSIPSSISVCWSSEGVGVFSLLLKGGHPKVKLLWAAGGATLSPLVSNETEEMGDDGRRELRSVCALERSTSLLSQTNEQLERQKNGDAISTCYSYN